MKGLNVPNRMMSHWPDGLLFGVGLWLFYSPSIMPALFKDAIAGGDSDLAIWNEWTSGVLAMLCAFIALWTARPLGAWSAIGLGLWLGAAPWILGFQYSATHARNTFAAGFLLAVSGAAFLLARHGVLPFFAAETLVREWISKLVHLLRARMVAAMAMRKTTDIVPPANP